MPTIEPYRMCDSVPDFHSVESIQLGELINGGLFDWRNDVGLRWDAYSEEQYERVCTKFVNRFFYREIGIVPYGQWILAYVRKMNEIMPKYKPFYKNIEEGADILATEDTYGKSRDLFSDFPATMLSGNEDYASNGTDRQYENVHQGDFMEKLIEAKERYNDIDVMILEECETLFSCFMTVSVNGF